MAASLGDIASNLFNRATKKCSLISPDWSTLISDRLYGAALSDKKVIHVERGVSRVVVVLEGGHMLVARTSSGKDFVKRKTD